METEHSSPSNTKSSTTPGKKGSVDSETRRLKHQTLKRAEKIIRENNCLRVKPLCLIIADASICQMFGGRLKTVFIQSENN